MNPHCCKILISHTEIDWKWAMCPFLPLSKITPEQDMKAQRGEYRYRSTFSSNSVLDRGGLSMPCPGRERDTEPVLQEAGWTTGTVWMRAENLTLTGNLSPDRQSNL
jgi:hypothetical protein